MKKYGVAIIGCGSFAKSFVPLFKHHPAIGQVFVCDVIKEKAERHESPRLAALVGTNPAHTFPPSTELKAAMNSAMLST